MNDGELRQLIAARLDEKGIADLRQVMEMPEGRRFLAWLMMKCGQHNTSFAADNRIYFNEGMRNVALMLESCLKAMGLEGVDLLHQAERELVALAEEIRQEISEEAGG